MLSKRQKELLDYLARGQKRIDYWMHTSTIAAMQKRKYVVLVCKPKYVYLELTPLGKMVRTLKELDYFEMLKSTSKTRRQYRDAA